MQLLLQHVLQVNITACLIRVCSEGDIWFAIPVQSCLCFSGAAVTGAHVTFTSQVESPHRMANIPSTKDANHDDNDNGSEGNKGDQGDDGELSIATLTDDNDNDGVRGNNLVAR